MRMLVMQLAAQLPDDKADARAVVATLRDFVENWLYEPCRRLESVAGAALAGESASNLIVFTGNPDRSPR